MSELIDEKLVRHVAHLSRLTLSESEMVDMRRELSAIVGYIDKLREVDTDGVPDTAHAAGATNVFRDDEIRESLAPDQALTNAPQSQDNFFRVPKVLDDGGA